MSAITDKWLKAVPLYTDTLAGAISNATVTTFQVTNGSTDLENGEVYEVTIDRVTAQGVSTGRREVVIAQYTSATKTFDCSSADYRGIEGTAQAHPVGAVVEILVTAHYLNEHRAAFLVGHTQAGAHASALPLTSPVLTTPVINTGFSGTAKATAAEVATGTDDTKIVTPLAAAPYGNSSLARQALINPNFDVFQRVTFASQTSSGYCLDHWYAAVGGTVTITQQTTGAPVGSTYVARVTYNAASSFANLSQALELVDAKKLWGKNVTATVKLRKGGSFAANIALKVQKNATGDTMTGGSWSDIGLITIANAALPTGTGATDWVTATVTVTIPSDGTANGIRVTIGESAAGGNAEYWEASQVQLCAGDVALPFQPKSFNQELLDCQRYTVDMLGGSALANIIVATGECNSTTRLYSSIQLPVTMRIAPTLVAGTASNFSVGYWTGANIACTAMSVNIATPQMVLMNFDVAAGLTANYPARIFRPGTTEKLLFTAEL